MMQSNKNEQNLLINEIQSKVLPTPKRRHEQLVASLLPTFLTERYISGYEFGNAFDKHKTLIHEVIQDTLHTSTTVKLKTNGLSYYYFLYPKSDKKTTIIYAAKQIQPLGFENLGEILTTYKGQLRIYQPKINFELAKNIIDNPEFFLLEKKLEAEKLNINPNYFFIKKEHTTNDYKIEHTKKSIMGNLEIISSSGPLLDKLGIYPEKWCEQSMKADNKSYNVETTEFNTNDFLEN